MHFKLNQLKPFLKNIEKNQINELNIQSNHLTITVNKNIYTSYQPYFTSFDTTLQSNKKYYSSNSNNKNTNSENNIEHQEVNLINKKSKILNESNNYSTIVSPMVGTFYRAPGPNEPSFIEKNDVVEKKQTVCIIEAMKLMNEIEAEVHGEIVEILVQDGEIVDCGQALIKVKKLI
uniref:Biotin carboxyl carrier protein of acetyl-CoA carboxylase n=1 Tax=Anotrichium furcellatum TaxID=41999 RepID=A0A4D6WP23_9FLOR|nr:acetyl-CoA carboxylase, biotin carboxyl carrier protein [Anotrichium furcellatum]